jgi:hypothetical protein
MISVLGPPPLELLARGRHSEKLFTKEGMYLGEFAACIADSLWLYPGSFKAGLDLLAPTSLEALETSLDNDKNENDNYGNNDNNNAQVEEKAQFLRFMRKMLQ